MRLTPEIPPRRRLLVALLAATVGLAMAFAGDDSAPGRLELASLDWRFRLRGPQAPGPEVLVLAIDDPSIAAIGQWPPSRALLAEVVDMLGEAGARVIAINLILGDPPRPLPPVARAVLQEAASRLGPGDAALRRSIEDLLAEANPDAALAAAFRRFGRVAIAYAFIDEAGQGGRPPPSWLDQTAITVLLRHEAVTAPAIPGGSSYLGPDAALAEAAAAVGQVGVDLDSDGILRRHPVALQIGAHFYPSLAVEAVRLYEGLDRHVLALDVGRELWLGERGLPLDQRSSLIIDAYGPAGTLPTVSLGALLAGDVDPATFRDRLVVLGATAAGLGDRFATPLAHSLSGTEHLAEVAAGLLHGRALLRSITIRALDGAACIALALATAFLAGRRALSWSVTTAMLLAAAWSLVTVLLFLELQWWLALVGPVLAVVAAAGLVEGSRIRAERRLRGFMAQRYANLARYFAPPIAERLAGLDRPFAMDRTEVVAVMFVDLVGFTGRAQDLAPAEAMVQLRRFQALVEQAVFAHHGFVDKYLGDGALACFGVPDRSAVAAADAIAAARDLLAAMASAAGERGSGLGGMRAGIGIHLGPVLMGDLGGGVHVQFTVVGDTVNVASRLEALTREHDALAIVSGEAMASAMARDPDAAQGFVAMENLVLRGRTTPLEAWMLPGRPAGISR